ncbi:hypothetical protein JTB14_016500 [Gonioctena quinquepunctata]|nr:hypothetical protein JTB14_016500 [Gonioctena quinquepunctata]
MENNPLAVETLILCYIEAKDLLRTKQLDQSDFNELLIKSCKQFNKYSDEEIVMTWRNLVRQYLQIKNNNVEKEPWKYYKIMDSCYETSDFHQCGQSKFSEEMVWFLIECLLKRRSNKRSHNKQERMTEVYHEFLGEGYVNLKRHDIETKWRYLNYRYSKLKGNKEAPLKMPYFIAIDEFRKGKKFVKMAFTKSLTEILIRKFTEKKVMCNFHGYDSRLVLEEIRKEFLNLDANAGFDFFCEEIKDKWSKLINVYEFLKKKHKIQSRWMYFQAMKEHFEEETTENGITPKSMSKISLRKRSKSMGEPADGNKKSKLTVGDRIDQRSISPLDTNEEIKSESLHSVTTIKIQESKIKKLKNTCNGDVSNLSRKTHLKPDISKKELMFRAEESKLKCIEDFSGEHTENGNEMTMIKEEHILREKGSLKNEQTKENVCSVSWYVPVSPLKSQKKEEETSKGGTLEDKKMMQKQLNEDDITKILHKLNTTTSKEHQTTQNNNKNEVAYTNSDYSNHSSDLNSPQDSKVQIMNIHETSIDKDSGNITINFPSITKKFSDNEFLPLKKRLRLNDNRMPLSKEIKDGFRGFSVTDQIQAETCAQNTDHNRLTEKEMSEIMARIIREKETNPMNETNADFNIEENRVSYNLYPQGGNFSPHCVVLPKEAYDSLSVQTFNASGITQPSVLLFVVNGTDPRNEGDMKKNEGSKEESNQVTNGDQKYLIPSFQHNGPPPKQNVSTELIETSIIDEPMMEMEYGSFEFDNSNDHEPFVNIEENNQIVFLTPTLENEIHSNLISKTSRKHCELNSPDVEPLESTVDSNPTTQQNGIVEGTEINLSHLNSNKLNENEPSEIQFCNGVPSSTPYKNYLKKEGQAEKNNGNTKTEVKSVRLPVTCGGKLKEIFISPRELSKIVNMKSNSVKHTNSHVVMNGEDTLLSNNSSKNIKFISQIIREADVIPMKDHDLKNSTATSGILEQNGQTSSCHYDDSVQSESIADDEQLSDDDLLADVIDDLQAQSIQELRDIKKFLRENNLLARETNRILRQILEKL